LLREFCYLAAVHLLAKALAPLQSLIPHFTTSRRAARIISRIVEDPSAATGTYYDENGKPLSAPLQVSDHAFSDRYAAESRDLLATVSPWGQLPSRGHRLTKSGTAPSGAMVEFTVRGKSNSDSAWWCVLPTRPD
jgi:hypothetical protein